MIPAGAGAESRDSTLAEGRAALDGATRIILETKKGTTFLSLPSGEERFQTISSSARNIPFTGLFLCVSTETPLSKLLQHFGG